MGTRGEGLPKCDPHWYVDEMLAISLEFKCLVWIDFPARILPGVLGCVTGWSLKSQPCLWLPVGVQEGPFPLLCPSALL